MKKLKLLFILVSVSCLFFSCDNSGGDDTTDAISLGNTLDLSGEITRYFSSPTADWGSGPDDAADPYDLYNTTGGINDGALIVSDTDGTDTDDLFTFSTGTPPTDDMLSVEDWGFTSSESGVKVYSAEIQDVNDEQIKEFELNSEPAALWYEYIYASADTVISGTVVDGDETYKFDNVSVFQGWNKVISKTDDGYYYTYTGGSISGAVWTFMKD